MLFNVKLTAQLDIGSSNIFNKGILGVWSKQNKTKKTGRTGGMQPAIRRRNRSV